jgi:RNase P subunit RPR2
LQKQNGELTDKVKELEMTVGTLRTFSNEQAACIERLEKEKCELIGTIQARDKAVQELEAQIEKMKCCENCRWYYLQQHWRESNEINESRMFHCGTCGNKKNWKLREIKEK